MIIDKNLSKYIVFAEDDIRAYTIDSKKFVCFDEPAALKVLQLRLDLPKLESKILILQDKLAINVQEIEILEKNSLILKEKLGIVTNENVGLYGKLEAANAWWRSPWMWFGVGVLVGGSIAVGALALS